MITKKLLDGLSPLAPGEAKRRIFDDVRWGSLPSVARLSLRCTCATSIGDGGSREVKLGRVGDVTVEAARRQAEQIKAAVSLGGDPLADHKKAR